MSIDRLILALDGVRGGPDSWTARCPAHEDRHPSLAIRAIEDGRILIHCFAGCSADSVVAAVGMSLSDLMPPRPRDTPDGPGGRGPLNLHAAALLATAAREALIVALYVESEWQGEDLSLEDHDRAMVAARRLREFASRYEGDYPGLEKAAIGVAQGYAKNNAR